MRSVALVGVRDAALHEGLEAEGFATTSFDVSIAAIEEVLRRSFGVVVLDMERAGPHALSVCSEIAAKRNVIIVTADRSAESCLAAFACGVSDCVKRPFAQRELIARIRNVLWRTEGRHEPSAQEMHGVVVSVDAMRIRIDGRVIDLTPGEAEILRILIRQAPSPVTIRQIAESLSHSRPVAMRTIESRIKSIRRKLGAEHLVNRVRIGYQLNGVVAAARDRS